jgi:hypothetical protein
MTKMPLKALSINGLLLLFFMAGTVYGQPVLSYERDQPPTMDMLMSVKERFVYNVRYGFLNLGEVEVELVPDTTYQGKDVYYMRTIMRANSSIPFVGSRDVHYQNFFSYNEKWPYSYLFWRDDMHSEEYERYKIEFDRENMEVRFFEKGEAMDTLALEEPASGGDVIFYFARMFAGIEESFELPVYIENEKGYVTAKSSHEIEKRSYDAFPESIDTYLTEGVADIDGPFGFRGDFKAWFATDDLRIPVETHVRIIFGNVKIRLISYERLNETTGSTISKTGSR